MTTKPGRWPIARLLFSTHLPFLVICWFAMLAVTGVVLLGVAVFGTVRISAIDVGGQILRWLAVGYGAYLTHSVLPTYLVHGQTRGEFLRQVPVYQFVATGVLAGMTAAAYAGESLLYRANGWSQTFLEQRLYSDGGEYPVIFLSYWSMLLVWSLTGLFLGAAFYRLEAGGVLLLLVAVPLLIVSGLSNGFVDLPFVRLGFSTGFDPLTTVLVSGFSALVALAVAWALARDMPLRSKAG